MTSFRETVDAMTHEEARAKIFNDHYNDLIEDLNADYKLSIEAANEKTIPYQGWFWRYIDFYNRGVPLGSSGNYVGFMQNNKWGYAARQMTTEQVDEFIGRLDSIAAIREDPSERPDERALKQAAELSKLRDWIDSLMRSH